MDCRDRWSASDRSWRGVSDPIHGGEKGREQKEGGGYQKFEGEYLFATRRIASVESDDVGNTEYVEAG